MSRRTDSAIVAEIKTLYGRRHEEKLQIQEDMVELSNRGWSQRRIAEATGVPRDTVQNWLAAAAEAVDLNQPPRLTPKWKQDASDALVATRVLAQAPDELIERIVSELPKERQQQVAAAAGNVWAKARVEHNERERRLTPAQRKEREATRSSIDDFSAKMTSGFTGASITLLIEQATEKLHELVEADAFTAEIDKAVGAALLDLNREYQVATAMAGLEGVEL